MQEYTQMGFHIRPISPDDNPTVATLIREVMTEFGCDGAGYSIHDPEVDTMYEISQLPRSAFFVVTRDSEIVGVGGIAPLKGGEKDICEIQKMYFYPQGRGAGQGTKFLKLLVDTAKEKGFKTAYLETVERMATANKLYQRAGFTRLNSAMGSTGHNSCELHYSMPL